jgi:hypothetical protein
MTRTEERLSDALHASADRVRDDRLRPLPESEPGVRREPRRGRAWLVPAAAAASVVLVIAVAVALVGGPRPAPGADRSGSGGTGITAAEVPRYFAFFNMPNEHEFFWQVIVLSTVTGAEIARTPVLDNPSADPVSIAAAPDDRTFYVDYRVGTQTRIYTFSIPARGRTAPITLIQGGVVTDTAGAGYPPSLSGDQLAVSPDGTRLALSTGTAGRVIQDQDQANRIVVINLRTGAHSRWQGGLDRLGKSFGIINLSWADGGRSLVFLAQWCDDDGPAVNADPNGYCSGADTRYGYRDAEVWSLNATSGGGRLNDGRLLLRQSAQYPTIAQAIAGPGGTGLTAVVFTGPIDLSDRAGQWHDLEIDQISAEGVLERTDYRASHPQMAFTPGTTMLDWDPSGKYLIFTDGNQPLFAWVGDGTLHRLPFPSPVHAKVGFWWAGGPVAW